MEAIRQPILPNTTSQTIKKSSLHVSQISTESNEDHINDILDSAEKWITQQLLFHEYVTAFDLLEKFDVNPKLARMLITRFEKRTSTYAIYPLSMDSTIPRSSLQPLEHMLPSNLNTTTNANTDDRSYTITHHVASNSDSSFSSQTDANKVTTPTKSNNLFLEPTQSDNGPFISPSVSPRIYTTPYDYIDYNKKNFDTWFNREKHSYIISVQECAASYDIGLPEYIAEVIVINTVLLPGCYTLTGLLFPAARNESDLFAEYANKEDGYITNKTEKGIAYKRKKPMMNVRRPENNTASLWLDEDGSICGFRCIWVHGIRGKLMVDQKFCVLNGCWTLSGEVTITFEQWDVEDEFEGHLETETFQGRWTAGKELYGEFQWFITTIESFYLKHNIPIESTEYLQLNVNGNVDEIQISRLGFHDSMGVSMEDEFDLEDDILMSPINNQIKITDPINILYNKIFDIEINESLTISAKFLKTNNVLEISEKLDMSDIVNNATSSDSLLSEDENIVIGHGQWLRNGKMSFKNVKYTDQKLLLSFDGCCDGKKVLGRLCIYHDNTPSQSDNNSMNQLIKPKKTKSKHHMKDAMDIDDGDMDDEDDDVEDLFGSTRLSSHRNESNHADDLDLDLDDDDDSDDDDDDDERISFIQMIIVSNIIPG